MAGNTAIAFSDGDDDSITLDQWAEQCWPMLGVRARTLKDYQGKYRRNISPALGHMRLTQIKRGHVKAWMNSLPITIANAAFPILKTLFREAIDMDLIDNNVTTNVKRRKGHIKPKKEWLTLEEIEAINFGRILNGLYKFLALHGLRWSELANLKQEDFFKDSKGREFIRIVRSEDEEATKSSRAREIPYYGGWEPVFSERGYKWTYLKFKKATGGYTLHSLRYTYAQWLKRSGIPIQQAQALLGHSTIVLTMDLYGAIDPKELTETHDMTTEYLAAKKAERERQED